MQNGDPQNRELHVSKTLHAPIELVWEVWTKPEHIVNWWAPSGFTSTIHKMEVVEGGEWLLALHGPDGKNYPNKSIYKKVIPTREIIYQHFNPDFIATVTFERKGNKTLMNWTLLFETPEMLDIIVKTFKADKGLEQSAEKLETYLSQRAMQ